MWSLASEIGAIIVFAEHRYFGESMPSLVHIENCMSYLTSAQALADFSLNVPYIKKKVGLSHDSKVIAFGGSYGGMLSVRNFIQLNLIPTCNIGMVSSTLSTCLPWCGCGISTNLGICFQFSSVRWIIHCDIKWSGKSRWISISTMS